MIRKTACLFMLLAAVSIEGQWSDYGENIQICSVQEDTITPTRCTVTARCNGTVHFVGPTYILNCWTRYNQFSNFVLDFIFDIQNVNSYSFNNMNLPNILKKVFNIKIKMKNVDMVCIPAQMLEFENLNDFKITESAIEKIDISAFPNKIISINASHNRISDLDEEYKDQIMNKPLEILDLSFNLINKIPNNYFSSFINLTQLNLSHNYINKIDILTFEGLINLKNLNLSYNNLLSIGHYFIRFINLQELILNNNQITVLEGHNFIALTRLQVLNLSKNNILNIDESTFKTLSELKNLDLSTNKINNLPKNIFSNNSQLEYLVLSDNNINLISKGLFQKTNITYFTIKNNSITGMVEKETFQGIRESELDLSHNKIEGLGSDAFISLESTLIYLNLSHNELLNISCSAFSSANNVTTLDISYNKLYEINGYFKNLKQMKYLNVSNNSIKRLSKASFKNLISLVTLDLSFNSIEEIEEESFIDLKNLEMLELRNNRLTNSLTFNTFQGLIRLKRLFIMNTDIMSYEKYAFTEMKDLNIVNSSYGGLMTLDQDAFNDTGAIEILDFSHNLLEKFLVNSESIPELKELYLNNNRVQIITQDMFTGFSKLVILSLAENCIVQVDHNSFGSLSKLEHLDLSFNEFMIINSSEFEHMSSLYSLSLRNVKTSYNFTLVANATIRDLDMSSCNIEDIKSRYIYKLSNVNILNLSSNAITHIDKHSFQAMPVLTYLDLSLNHIKYVQPGSFIHTNLIRDLNLQDNEITNFQYGVFDGLQNLGLLNLASNLLGSFEVKILHNSPQISKILLDDNYIQIIDFDSFEQKHIRELSLGGNLISCDTLISFKNHNYSFKLTTQASDYHSENVDGITCKTSKDNIRNTEENSLNLTFAFASLTKSLDMLRNTILEHSSNNTNTPIYVTLICLLIFSCLCIYLSYSYFKRRSRIMNLNNFSSIRHLASDIEME